MTYTPEQLRAEVEAIQRGLPIGLTRAVAILNGYADALEELAILKNADVGMMWAQMQEDLRDFDAMKARAERAESALAASERKCERLKFHAEAMAVAWEKLDFDDGESEDAMEESVFAYRAYMGEE